MAEPQATEGQAAATDPVGTTDAAPDAGAGQSVTPQTTRSGPDTTAQGESFFDPKAIEHDPELVKAYKQMQGQFSKKMASVREAQSKIEAYDQAMRDPVGTLRQLAGQYGMSVMQGNPPADADGQPFSPKSWDDVIDRTTEKVRAELMQQYAPLVGEVKSLKQRTIEQHLDASYPDWRTYEDAMIETLNKHPSMATDPDTLYRMSVPAEVWEARATERALRKLKGGTDSAVTQGTSRATQTTSDRPEGKLTFDQAVKFAKDKLRKSGISAPIAG